VVETIRETPRVRTLVLRVPGWPGHRAGQHVDVRLTAEDGYRTQRSYSIASAPGGGERVELTIERIDGGEVSPYLVDELQVGDQVELRGPIGGYFVWEPAMGGPLMLIAGGSGICPLMSMLRLRAGLDRDVSARLLYSSRSLEDVIFRDELERSAAGGRGLSVVPTLTRLQPSDWAGRSRRIDAEMLAEVAWAPGDQPLVYVCGPTALVEVVGENLVRLGHDPGRIRTERFGPTGG
jgi:ferredoxin-NADP reductase